jgi:osmotically-inducible protein OsmY
MKHIFIRYTTLASMAVAAALATGCASIAVTSDASVAVTSDAMEQNTSMALGIPKGSFTISDRIDSGVKTTYSVKTNTGRQYICYVTGTVTTAGRTVSDAICTEMSKASQPASSTKSSSGSCNALLKAAGRC